MENTAPVVETTESTSLADHEQAFAPSQGRPVRSEPAAPVERADDGLDPPVTETAEQKADRERDEKTGQFTKQRAKSQRAGAEDVEQINAYTKRIREAEESLGIKVEKKPGESDRVFNLRRRAEILEAKREAAKEARPAPVLPKAPGKAPEPFTEPEPKYEDFANEPDQYAAHLRAVAAWDRKREAAESAIKTHETQSHEAIAARNKARDEWFKAREGEHLDRMAAYHEEHPEAQAILDKAGDVFLTPALYSAIMTAPNSPELLILVASQEELRDDLTILTDGKAVTKDLVALVQRRLNRGLTAGTTGAAPLPTRIIPAVPRPPTPVRTGPMKTDATPPGDEGNLADHEKFYGVKRG